MWPSLTFLEARSYHLCQQLFEPLLKDASTRPLARSYQACSSTQSEVGCALIAEQLLHVPA